MLLQRHRPRVKLLTLARDLSRRRARERSGLFMAEGIRTVEDLLDSDLAIRGVLISPALGRTERGARLRERLALEVPPREMEFVELDDRDLASAAGTDTPQGVVAVAAQPERSLASITVGTQLRILGLDGVQDPGNVGTILRTAHAFGIDATVALGGTVDLWNPKVVRSAMGALFRHHALATTRADLIAFCDRNRVTLWVAAATGQPVQSLTGAPERLAIVVGNEGNGPSDELTRAAERSVAIPISGVESLNVAVATGILLFNFSR